MPSLTAHIFIPGLAVILGARMVFLVKCVKRGVLQQEGSSSESDPSHSSTDLMALHFGQVHGVFLKAARNEK